MPIKKSELYSSLWRSCDELRGGWTLRSTRTTRLDAHIHLAAQATEARQQAK